jgi:ABC-type transporter Mla MlaB component
VSERAGEVMVVRPVGDVNTATVPAVWSNLRAMREDHLNVIVDLRACLRIDPGGIRAVRDMYQPFAQCGRRRAFAEPSPVVRVLRDVAALRTRHAHVHLCRRGAGDVSAARAGRQNKGAPPPPGRGETMNAIREHR